MNFFRRAIISIIRNPLRTIVIFMVVFIMGSVVAACVSTEVSAANLVRNTENNIIYSSTISINEDLVQLNPSLFENETVNQSLLDELDKGEAFTSYDYSLIASWNAPTTEDGLVSGKTLLLDVDYESTYRVDNLDIIGTSTGNIPAFVSNKVKMIEGRTFTEEEINSGAKVMLVPSNIATLNNLAVGDSLYFENYFYEKDQYLENTQSTIRDPDSKISRTTEVEIIGIYSIINDEVGSVETLNQEYVRLYMPNQTIINTSQDGIDFVKDIQNKLGLDNLSLSQNKYGAYQYDFSWDYFLSRVSDITYIYDTMVSTNPYFSANTYYTFNNIVCFFNDDAAIPSFIDNVTVLSDNKLFATSDYSTFQAILAPVKLTQMIAGFTKGLAIAALAFVLILVIQLFVNQRRYEIGVYLSLGEQKWKVVAQILIETLITASIALLLTVNTGIFLANRTSEQLVGSQLSEYRVYSWPGSSGEVPEAVVDEVQSSFKVELTPAYFAQYISLGLLVIVFSSITPVILMAKMKTKDILL